MNTWKHPWRSLRDASLPAGPEPPEHTPTAPAAGNAALNAGSDPPQEPVPVLHLALDEGPKVLVPLSEESPATMLEQTQRVRDERDRERSTVPPVYNFGRSESAWSGPGADW